MMAVDDPFEPFGKRALWSAHTTNLGTNLTNISTQLDKDTVLARLRELVEDRHRVRIFVSGIEGEVVGHNVVAGYRTGWFVPPMRIVSFKGRVAETDVGTTIVGEIVSSWFVSLFAAFFVLIPFFIVIDSVRTGEYMDVLWSIISAGVALLIGRTYVRAAGQGVIDEICKATRGKVNQ
jgi:VIT1/CCC1 family predicted Fe2+/Mn2+ transporter